jgi:TolA-binding protein
MKPFLTAVTISAITFTSSVALASGRTPSLVITNDPLPVSLSNQIYAKPSPAPVISPSQIMGSYFEPSNSMVSKQIGDLQKSLSDLQNRVSSMSDNLAGLQRQNQNTAAEYYANVATINTQLQSGTTPGNPRLLGRLNAAKQNLEQMDRNTADLNNMAIEIAKAATESSFMLENTRGAYSLTGAVEEDHVQLAQLEDSINNTIIVIDRLQNNISDDVSRSSSYLTTERNNMRTLSLAITNGDLFGKSLANRPFSSMARDSSTVQQALMANPVVPPSTQNPRPLAKIRFDKANVNYEQPVYMAMNEALAKYPNSRYEIVAVHPSMGNAAQLAIESTKSRRNAEQVLRTITAMGVPMDKVDISTSPSADATSSEVHIYIR